MYGAKNRISNDQGPMRTGPNRRRSSRVRPMIVSILRGGWDHAERCTGLGW